jgi:hypothetical protein
MPIFKCSKCGCIENTALCDYWWDVHKEKNPICSECSTGKWYGKFEKQVAKDMLVDRDGFLWDKNEIIPNNIKIVSSIN